MTTMWTNGSALTGTPHSTYVGAEGALMLLGVRVSVGVTRRVEGPAGPSRTLPRGGWIPPHEPSFREHSRRRAASSEPREVSGPR
jgi:hypothetical protein